MGTRYAYRVAQIKDLRVGDMILAFYTRSLAGETLERLLKGEFNTYTFFPLEEWRASGGSKHLWAVFRLSEDARRLNPFTYR